jgi:hypothetical protein
MMPFVCHKHFETPNAKKNLYKNEERRHGE